MKGRGTLAKGTSEILSILTPLVGLRKTLGGNYRAKEGNVFVLNIMKNSQREDYVFIKKISFGGTLKNNQSNKILEYPNMDIRKCDYPEIITAYS